MLKKKPTRKPALKKKLPVRKPAKKISRPVPKKKKAARKKVFAPPPGAGPEIGRIIAFFRIPVVAVIRVTQGSLKPGDGIWIKGHTTDIKQTAASLQIDHQPVPEVRKGQEAGLKVSARARIGDRVYRLA